MAFRPAPPPPPPLPAGTVLVYAGSREWGERELAQLDVVAQVLVGMILKQPTRDERRCEYARACFANQWPARMATNVWAIIDALHVRPADEFDEDIPF